MAQYLLVRESDGAILGEIASAESALRMLDLLGELARRDLSVVRVEESPGEVIGTSSVTRVRSAEFTTRDPRR